MDGRVWWLTVHGVAKSYMTEQLHFLSFFPSCTRCYWWLGDAGSYIQVLSLVWMLTILYSQRLVLLKSRVLEFVLQLQRLRA